MSNTAIPTGNYVFGKYPAQAPECSALRILVEDVIPSGLALRRADVVLYALSWLAASRLLLRGEIPGFSEMSELLLRDCWESGQQAGLPTEAIEIVWPAEDGTKSHEATRVRVLGLIADLVSQFGTSEWNLADSISEIGDYTEGVGYDTGLCDTLIELLDAPPGASVWIPFDFTGQLVIRALRRDLRVVFAGPGRNLWSSLIIRLLAVIEGRASHLTTEASELNIHDGTSLKGVGYLLACPPIGMKVIPGAGWRKWEGSELGLPGSESIYRRMAGQSFVQLDRSESWAIAALWPHVKVRAVFLTAPNILFAKGQEQRLREFMVLGAEQPVAVISLPARLINRTGIVTTITVLDREHNNKSVRMVDASSATVETKLTMRFARLLDPRRVVELATSSLEVEGIAKTVTLDEVASQECNLMPMRYLKAWAGPSEDRVPLGDLVAAIVRAPVASKDASAITVQEAGIADLDRWTELKGPFAKTATIPAKKLAEHSLRHGDILVSIKGTIGKIGLVGNLESKSSDLENLSIVCSQSCIALRANREKIGVIPLYLYLRSDDFKNQLEAFRVGVSVAHVTPATLLQDVKVPLKAVLDEAAQDLYGELCKLEMDVEQAHRRMDEIRRSL